MRAANSTRAGLGKSRKTRLLAVQAATALKSSESARRRARLTKIRFKQARKVYKLARKAAKLARKKARQAQNALEAALLAAARATTRRVLRLTRTGKLRKQAAMKPPRTGGLRKRQEKHPRTPRRTITSIMAIHARKPASGLEVAVATGSGTITLSSGSTVKPDTTSHAIESAEPSKTAAT